MRTSPVSEQKFDGDKRLSNYQPVSRTTMHGGGAALFGIPFWLTGLVIVLVALDVIHADPSSIHAPRWVLGLVGAIFFVVGIGVSVQGLAEMRRTARLKANKASRPGEPWFADHDWNPVGSISRQGSPFLMHLIGATVIFGFAGTFNWVAFVGPGSWVFKVVAIVINLVVVAVVVGIVRSAIARLKFGRPVAEFGNFPGRPGQPLRLRVHCGQQVEEAKSLVATLRFIEERYVKSGSGEDAKERVVSIERYKDRLELNGYESRKLGTTGLELEFALPKEAPSTNLRGRPASYWELEVRASVPGADFLHRFLVPVYAN